MNKCKNNLDEPIMEGVDLWKGLMLWCAKQSELSQ